MPLSSVFHALEVHPEGYRLVVVDTVGRSMQGVNENAQEYASTFTRLVDLIRDKLGATVLALHHTGHEASTRARGSSVFGADADTMVRIDREEGANVVCLTMVKQKDAPEWEKPTLVQLDSVQLSLEESTLVAVKPTAETADRVEITAAKPSNRSKHDPNIDPGMMDLLDVAVVKVLQSNWMQEWTQADLAAQIAMRPEIHWSSEHLRRRALVRLREDNARAANKLYRGAPRKKWRGMREDDLESLLSANWGPPWRNGMLKTA